MTITNPPFDVTLAIERQNKKIRRLEKDAARFRALVKMIDVENSTNSDFHQLYFFAMQKKKNNSMAAIRLALDQYIKAGY